MPRLKHAVPKLGKHRATGKAVVNLNGRDFYLGTYGSKSAKVDYDRLIAEWLAGGRRLTDGSASVTVVEVIAAFFRWAKVHYRGPDGKPTGSLANLRFALRPLKHYYDATVANDFGPKSLKALQGILIGKGLSRRTINDQIRCIRQVFRWAVSEELVSSSVHHELVSVSGMQRGRTEARESAPVQPVDDAVVQATLRQLPEVVADA